MNTLVNATSAVKASCPMIMVFHGGHCERILWRSWVASTVVEFGFSCVAWFFIAFMYEAIKFARQQLYKRSAQKASERMALEVEAKRAAHPPGCTHASSPLPEIRGKTYREHLFSKDHIIQTLLNVVQIIISYLLMLVFMNFNYWLCLSMILGLGFGYFCFGWVRQSGIGTECCT
ncbi:high affinity copper uptake protein 1 isoform X2 [Anastrepha ludens]|uniref:high affinity copper uptake protein 1 isoform X2 n=1 Tax=Anastrepha ludens TaxID=28586 RepID=UPI0023AEB7D8|nr:high affinity copper uptake protein 1 isoform X2 [Anastrepha ludens]XP_053946517.1 high affinity copper uptake protein 1 isoform X2 [Anastrepha ludens]XP_053946519.1 high affinity copper uptake protein 1 isoform X2 [Anastrepha ludens]XP_053946520.1 high affinity copper uptake protein 1 isoform X2 [Anastrepha ludens]XP_053946521.1 high affinity copper uptake protein 1 isoform X2 [Anastrepha ludens]XP_053946522.1 high affinity copper uptake protein 1 isoform X2 [Anastrepha ludens]